MYSINLRRMKTEIRYLMDAIYWAGSYYWTSRSPGTKCKKSNVNVRVIFLEKFNWYAFAFSRYHQESLKIFQELPTYDAYFFKEVVNRFAQFAGWCIDGKHFEQVLTRLQQITDIELEFALGASSGKERVVPKAFEALNLSFYERRRAND